MWWVNWRLSPSFGQWDSFRVPSDHALLLLVTVWRWVFDCGSLEWISRDKALVPARGSHSGLCLLSHFPDKPNCISQECPGPNPCPAWPRRCLGFNSLLVWVACLGDPPFYSLWRNRLWNLAAPTIWLRGFLGSHLFTIKPHRIHL